MDSFELNADELFYREYYQASQNPETLKDFLARVDREDAVRRHLVIPEILPEIISFYMKDDEYFDDSNRDSIFISRHNRYTPAFLHKHDFFEVVCVYSGHCVQSIETFRTAFHEGDVIFLSPGVCHTMEVFDDDTVVFNILLRKSTFFEMFSCLRNINDMMGHFFTEGIYSTNRISHIVIHSGEESRLAMKEMYDEQMRKDPYTNQILAGMMIVFTGLLLRYDHDRTETSFTERTKNLPNDFLVMNYIRDNLEHVSLSDVADHFGFSVPYCSRLIRKATGQGFNEWKTTIRIRRAELLLQNTTQPISAIADTLGYMNPETFIRAFKKELHMTPARYRKQALEQISAARTMTA